MTSHDADRTTRPCVTVRVMVRVAAWCAAKRCLHLARGIARAPTNSAPSACVTNPACPTCTASARSSSDRRAVVAHTIYECPSCGERLVGERRCPDCQLFSRAIGLGGHCPECDTPLLLVDLLGEEVVGTR